MSITKNTTISVNKTYVTAMSNGDDEIVLLLRPYVSINELMNHIDSTTNTAFSKEGVSAFIKDAYTDDEINSLIRKGVFLSSPTYRNMVKSFPLKLSHLDDITKSKFIIKMVAEGLNFTALKMLNTMVDKNVCGETFSKFIKDESISKNRTYDEMFLIKIGPNSQWNRYLFDLLDIIDIDLPPDMYSLTGKLRNKWSPAAFDEIVNGVRNVMEKQGVDLPAVEVSSGRLKAKAGQDLINAIATQHSVLYSPGVDAIDFPNYIPCSYDQKDEIALLELGAKKCIPDLQCKFSNLPRHGFAANNLADFEVVMSMSLLPHKVVSQLLKDNNSIMLVPTQAFEPEECANDELRRAVRYYRPLPIIDMSSTKGRGDIIDSDNGIIEAYLSGILLDSSHYGDNILNSLRVAHLAQYLVTDNELNFFKKSLFILHDDGDINKHTNKSLIFLQANNDIQDEVVRLKNELALMKSKFGAKPRYSIGGSIDFMEEIRKEVPDIKFGELGPVNSRMTDIDRSQRYTSGSYISMGFKETRRLVRLGACEDEFSLKYGANVSEIIRNVLRFKDNHERNIALGLLDQHDLIDVVSSASTQKQLEFIVEHYNVRPILKKLEPKLQRKMAKILVTHSFGGHGMSL